MSSPAPEYPEPFSEATPEKRSTISLRTFLLLCNTSFLLLFFLIVLYLLRLQNETTTLRSNLQVQGEVSRQIENQISAYFQNASGQLQGLYRFVKEGIAESGGIAQEPFFQFAEALMAIDLVINALYYGNEQGSFYMVKRTREGFPGRRLIENDGQTITSRWIFSERAAELVSPGAYPALQVLPASKGYDPRDRGWYQSAQQAQAGVESWVGPYVFFTDKFIGMTGAIGMETAEGYGVVGIDINVANLSNFLRELPFGKTGYIAIKNSKDELVAVSDKESRNYDITQIKFEPDTNTQNIEIRKVSELDSSPTMNFFSKGVLLQDTKQLAFQSVWQENLLDKLLTIFFPEYAKSSNIRNILLEGIDYGNVSIQEKNYLFTHNKIHPFPNIQWDTYTFTDVMDISNSLDYLSTIIIWIFFAIVLLFIFLLQYISKIISSPLGMLSTMMESFSKHLKLDKNFESESRVVVTEIDNIGQVYNNLQNGFRSFKKFVPDVIVQRSMSSSFLNNERLGSNMQKKQVSILFSDIEDFTSISESLEPEVLCRCLEVYFSAMSEEIGNNQGLIDKFIGDAVMALFGAFSGAEEKQAEVARQALTAALGMREKTEQINRQIQRDIDAGVSFRTRIGISSGEAMIGILGSTRRLNFTAIGDRVNLASRLEGVNKQYGTNIIVSKRSKELTQDIFVFRYLGSINVRGKTEAEKVYELIDFFEKVSERDQSYYKNFGQLQMIIEEGNPIKTRRAITILQQHFSQVQDPVFEKIKGNFYKGNF